MFFVYYLSSRWYCRTRTSPSNWMDAYDARGIKLGSPLPIKILEVPLSIIAKTHFGISSNVVRKFVLFFPFQSHIKKFWNWIKIHLFSWNWELTIIIQFLILSLKSIRFRLKLNQTGWIVLQEISWFN